MKLSELIKNNSWLSIKLTFLELYPEDQKSIQAYEEIFEKLSMIWPENSDMEIVIQLVTDDFDGGTYAAVSGKNLNADDSELYTLDFTVWAEWLGMEISNETKNSFSELEIISYCLFEMTFMGFDEEAIQREAKKLEDQINELDNMTEEERKKNLIPWEEVKKRFENNQ